MPEIMNAKQILATYANPAFQKEFFLLNSITDILGESIISDSYKVPQDLIRPIVLTEYGNDIYRQLRRKNVGHAEAVLLCFLQFSHVDLLIDIEQTNRDAIIASIHRQILARQLILPFRYGRMLYDKFADLFSNQVRSYLSLRETFQLLRDTPQGVYQVVDLVTGPFGVLRSGSYRYLLPDREIPLRHCEAFACDIVHDVILSTSRTADINEHRKTMTDILKRESEHGSEWGPFIGKISAPYIPMYKDIAFDPVIFLIGDAIVDDELRRLTEWLFEHSNDRVRQAAVSVGLQGDPQNFVSSLDRAQMMQLILTAEDESIMTGLDTLIQRGTISVPHGEIRTPVVNQDTAFGRYRMRAQLGEFGVRIKTTGNVAPLRARRLVEQMYLLDKNEDRQELEWQLRREQGESLEAKLERYLQTKAPREALKNLILTRRSNVIVAMQHLALIDGSDESDDMLIDSVLWKLGFEVIDLHPRHEKFFGLHQRMLLHTRQSPIGNLESEIEEVRGTAANYFTELESLLDDSLAYITWALTNDHYVSSKPFIYRPTIDRKASFDLLSQTGRRQPREKLTFGDRTTLYGLMRGFALLAEVLEDFEGKRDEVVRPEEQLPPWVGVQSLQRFAFMHTVPFLDLLEESRVSIVAALKEISAALVASDISESRNEWLHGRRTMANVERLRLGLEKVGEAVNRITESGFARDRYYWARDDSDGDDRRTVIIANGNGRTISLFRPTSFAWLGLPNLSDSWYAVHTARFAEPSEILRFGVEFESPYAKMWTDYPRRPSADEPKQGLSLMGPADTMGIS